MSEFKGTPAPWKIINDKDDTYFPSVVFSDTDDNTVFGVNRRIVINESHDKKMDSIRANALLISKAPEMLDEINESIKDLLCMQISINEAMKTDSRWGGMYELLQKQIDRKKELIKSATEI